jgi:transposase
VMPKYAFPTKQLAECDGEIELQLQRLQAHDGDPTKGKKRGRARNAPKFDLRTRLFQMCGVDLTRIDGIDVTSALAVVSEIGVDMSRFPSIKHFTSWLGLCPGTKITGGLSVSGKTKRVVNHAAQALRLSAAALRSSKSALGAYFTSAGCAHAWINQGRHCRRPQAGAADLYDADQHDACAVLQGSR